jgi:AraC-like DNA-binding protein
MDRDVRFHHVVPALRVIEARQCARRWVLFHETYAIALMGRAQVGAADWRYRHRSFVVDSEHAIMALQPGELHATLKQTPRWDFIALEIGDTLMRSIAEELGWRPAQLNISLARAGHTDPDMVRVLRAFQATLCTTLFADLERPGHVGVCTCAGRADAILEALGAIVRVFVARYAEGATELSQPRRGSAPLRKARAYLHEHYRDPYSLDRIAEASGCGKYYLAHLFKQEFGVSLWQYHSRILVSKTCEALVRFPDRPLKEVALEVGWPSKVPGGNPNERRSVMIRNFRRVLGTTPDRFRGPLRGSVGQTLFQDLAQGRAGEGTGGGGFVGERAGENGDHVLRRASIKAD